MSLANLGDAGDATVNACHRGAGSSAADKAAARVSSLYRTAPWGGQRADFINAVAAIETCARRARAARGAAGARAAGGRERAAAAAHARPRPLLYGSAIIRPAGSGSLLHPRWASAPSCWYRWPRSHPGSSATARWSRSPARRSKRLARNCARVPRSRSRRRRPGCKGGRAEPDGSCGPARIPSSPAPGVCLVRWPRWIEQELRAVPGGVGHQQRAVRDDWLCGLAQAPTRAVERAAVEADVVSSALTRSTWPSMVVPPFESDLVELQRGKRVADQPRSPWRLS